MMAFLDIFTYDVGCSQRDMNTALNSLHVYLIFSAKATESAEQTELVGKNYLFNITNCSCSFCFGLSIPQKKRFLCKQGSPRSEAAERGAWLGPT